jgi:hypothetical protein
MSAPSMKRYAAKLLFQFRVTIAGDSGKRRICEERIIVLKAPSGRAALAKAKGRGKQSQFRYKNTDGNPVRFEFIGILDLLCLGPECEKDEVWYDIRDRLLPSERKGLIIPPERELNAIRLGC